MIGGSAFSMYSVELHNGSDGTQQPAVLNFGKHREKVMTVLGKASSRMEDT